MKKSTESCNLIALSGLQFFIGSAILFPLSLFFEGYFEINWHASFTWSLLLLAIPGTSVATILWLYLLKRVELNILAAFTFLTPAYGFLIGYVVFNERYSPREIFGIILTLLGIFLTTVRSVRGQRNEVQKT